MVNREFYAVANELMQRAAKGTISAVVDYSTFVDAGKKLADLPMTDLVSDWVDPIMRKVQKTINDNPSYIGSLTDMYAGSIDYGVLETLMTNFYDMSQSAFDGASIVNGTTYTDQFKVNMLDKNKAIYHSKSDSFGFDLTIRDTDVRGCFTSPSAMDSWIASLFTAVSNSIEFAKEQARLGVVASIIKRCNEATAETEDETKAAQHYDLLSIYNSKFGTTLTKENVWYNESAIRFFVATINDIAMLMQKPMAAFNSKGSDENFVTFTPRAYQKLKINSIFSKAIKVSLIDAYHTENAVLGNDAEVLPYWQNEADRMRVTTNTSGDTTYSESVIALLYDKRACGEMVQLESVESDRNGKYKYTNYHYQESYMYWENEYANAVIFTVG